MKRCPTVPDDVTRADNTDLRRCSMKDYSGESRKSIGCSSMAILEQTKLTCSTEDADLQVSLIRLTAHDSKSGVCSNLLLLELMHVSNKRTNRRTFNFSKRLIGLWRD